MFPLPSRSLSLSRPVFLTFLLQFSLPQCRVANQMLAFWLTSRPFVIAYISLSQTRNVGVLNLQRMKFCGSTSRNYDVIRTRERLCNYFEHLEFSNIYLNLTETHPLFPNSTRSKNYGNQTGVYRLSRRDTLTACHTTKPDKFEWRKISGVSLACIGCIRRSLCRRYILHFLMMKGFSQ